MSTASRIYNDTYGHPQGDVLLKRLSGAVARKRPQRGHRRPVGRRRVHHRDAGNDQGRSLAHRRTPANRRRLRRLPRPSPTTKTPRSTKRSASASPPSRTTPDDMQTLIAMADQALYRAKHGGRNQIVVAGGQTSIAQHSEHAAALPPAELRPRGPHPALPSGFTVGRGAPNSRRGLRSVMRFEDRISPSHPTTRSLSAIVTNSDSPSPKATWQGRGKASLSERGVEVPGSSSVQGTNTASICAIYSSINDFSLQVLYV